MNIQNCINKNNLFSSSSSLSIADNLEFRLVTTQFPNRMQEIPEIKAVEDFHRGFMSLSRKAQYLFRIIQDWPYIECFPSQTLLSKMIGCSRKHVNKLLKLFHKLGFIKKHYRHRKTCIYFVKDFLKKLVYKHTQAALLKEPEVTQKVTPSSRTSNKNSLYAFREGEKGEKPPDFIDPKTGPPDWVPKWDEIKAKYHKLAREIFEDPSIYWKMCAFPAHKLRQALESLLYAQDKKGYIRTSHTRYLMGTLYNITPKELQNWKLANKLIAKHV